MILKSERNPQPIHPLQASPGRKAVRACATSAAPPAVSVAFARHSSDLQLITGVDPAIGWIETHEKLTSEHLDACERFDLAQFEAYKIHGRCPSTLVHWRNYQIGGSELETRRDALLEMGEVPQEIEKEYQQAKQDEANRHLAAAAWIKKAGLIKLERAHDRGWRALLQHRKRVAKVKPTTAAGVAALLQYVMDDGLCEGTDWHESALKASVNALLSKGGRRHLSPKRRQRKASQMIVANQRNPQPIVPLRSSRRRMTEAPGIASSMLPSPQTMSRHPDLMAEIDRLVAHNDVRSMIALYDAYADMARAVQAVENQPRAVQAEEFLSLEFAAAMSKAEIVVFHLHQMKIGKSHSGEVGRVIVDCAMKLGMGIHEAIAVVSSACAPQDSTP